MVPDFDATALVTETVPLADVQRICTAYHQWLAREGFLKQKAPTGPRTPEEQTFLAWVWSRWQEVMGYKSLKLRLGSRAKYALARFREGRTMEEFEEVLVWAAQDDWLRGRDPKTNGKRWDDFDTLFGSAEKFDKYLKKARAESLRAKRGAPLAAVAEGRRL